MKRFLLLNLVAFVSFNSVFGQTTIEGKPCLEGCTVLTVIKTPDNNCNGGYTFSVRNNTGKKVRFQIYAEMKDGNWISLFYGSWSVDPNESEPATSENKSFKKCDLTGKYVTYYFIDEGNYADYDFPRADEMKAKYSSTNANAANTEAKSTSNKKTPSKSTVATSPGLYEKKDKPFKKTPSTKEPEPEPGKALKAKQ